MWDMDRWESGREDEIIRYEYGTSRGRNEDRTVYEHRKVQGRPQA